MTALQLLTLALATYTVASTITQQSGPWRVFTRVREVAPLGGLTTCVYCTAPWAALALWALYPVAAWVVEVLAITGAALMLGAYTGVRHGV